jgi:hypothetical protein
MTHNLSVNPRTGQVSMMFYGETPWHGLGRKLDNPANSAEAIRASGLDREVVKQLLYVKTQLGDRVVEDNFVMMRAGQLESSPCVGIVGSNYTPLQNLEAFRFFVILSARERQFIIRWGH